MMPPTQHYFVCNCAALVLTAVEGCGSKRAMFETLQGSVAAVLRTIRAQMVGTKNSSLLPSCSYTNLQMQNEFVLASTQRLNLRITLTCKNMSLCESAEEIKGSQMPTDCYWERCDLMSWSMVHGFAVCTGVQFRCATEAVAVCTQCCQIESSPTRSDVLSCHFQHNHQSTDVPFLHCRLLISSEAGSPMLAGNNPLVPHFF